MKTDDRNRPWSSHECGNYETENWKKLKFLTTAQVPKALPGVFEARDCSEFTKRGIAQSSLSAGLQLCNKFCNRVRQKKKFLNIFLNN
jgi:hypothetical protein